MDIYDLNVCITKHVDTFLPGLLQNKGWKMGISYGIEALVQSLVTPGCMESEE